MFESLAATEHSKRIHTLNINFRSQNGQLLPRETTEFSLGSCRFFTLSFPQLASLEWESPGVRHNSHAFSKSPFTSTIRYLSFDGSWNGLFTQVNNLTSFTLTDYEDTICVEAFRLFILINQSLESLALEIDAFEGEAKGPPVDLLNLKSFAVRFCPKVLSTIIRVPALQLLSSLRISYEGDDYLETLRLVAAGDGVTLSVVDTLSDIAEAWQDLVGYAQPTIGHVRLCDYLNNHRGCIGCDSSAIIPLLADAHTLEVGCDYLMPWYDGFLDDLKQLGPQLKTIRFEVWEEMEPFRWGHYRGEMSGYGLLDSIEELVKYRFESGRPFSVVERMVVCESERSNRQQDYVWRCFYGDRELGRYVRLV